MKIIKTDLKTDPKLPQKTASKISLKTEKIEKITYPRRCNRCTKIYKHKSSFSRHREKCKKSDDIVITKKMINELKKKFKKELKEELKNEICTEKKNINMSTLKLIEEKFKNPFELKSISPNDLKKATYEINYKKEFDDEEDFTDSSLCELFISYKKAKKFHILLKDIIIKHYKTKSKKKQSFWITDNHRLSGVYATKVNDELKWINHKSGTDLKNIIVMPLLDTINKYLKKYMSDLQKKYNEAYVDRDSCISDISIIVEIQCDLIEEKFPNMLLKSFAKEFYINKSDF
uniref:Uncharacterized protein n=1 Tax=viral metagenome TaxID=1070528 RepID=A0A6C0EF11_9ZZZZ